MGNVAGASTAVILNALIVSSRNGILQVRCAEWRRSGKFTG